MGGKWKPRQLQEIKPRSRVARAMIEGGTGKGGPMRDRRERRPKNDRHDIDRIDIDRQEEDLRSLQVEELFYDAQETD